MPHFRMFMALFTGAALLGASACTEAIRPPAPVVPLGLPPVPAPNGVAVYLSLSSDSPRPGDHVLVTARAIRGSAAKGVGSFTLSVDYDAAQLTLVDKPVASEGVVAFNAVDGHLVAAGASTTGFVTGELFHFVIAVGNPDALRSLRVQVKEVVSTTFGDHRSSLVVARDLVRELVHDLLPSP